MTKEDKYIEEILKEIDEFHERMEVYIKESLPAIKNKTKSNQEKK
jgi:hypothetical protein